MGILTSDVVDVFLVVLHAGNIVLQGHQLVPRNRGVVSQQLRQPLLVLSILVDAELKDECN